MRGRNSYTSTAWGADVPGPQEAAGADIFLWLPPVPGNVHTGCLLGSRGRPALRNPSPPSPDLGRAVFFLRHGVLPEFRPPGAVFGPGTIKHGSGRKDCPLGGQRGLCQELLPRLQRLPEPQDYLLGGPILLVVLLQAPTVARTHRGTGTSAAVGAVVFLVLPPVDDPILDVPLRRVPFDFDDLDARCARVLPTVSNTRSRHRDKGALIHSVARIPPPARGPVAHSPGVRGCARGSGAGRRRPHPRSGEAAPTRCWPRPQREGRPAASRCRRRLRRCRAARCRPRSSARPAPWSAMP